jgi:hypothetical protein
MSKKETFFPDASVLINVLGTGAPEEFMDIASTKFVVAEQVVGEVKRDPYGGQEGPAILLPLLKGGYLEQVELDEQSLSLFFDLVGGGASAEDNLDDGEAATIACAVAHRGVAILDERKGQRICRERFAHLPVMCSVDLFKRCLAKAENEIQRIQGWLHNALTKSRMRVPVEHRKWVKEMLGRN